MLAIIINDRMGGREGGREGRRDGWIQQLSTTRLPLFAFP